MQQLIWHCRHDQHSPNYTHLFAVGEDFEAPLTSTVVLTQEDSVEEILIPVIDDELFEGATDETFNVGISLPSCSAPGMLTIENAQSIVSIEDNDVRPGECYYS